MTFHIRSALLSRIALAFCVGGLLLITGAQSQAAGLITVSNATTVVQEPSGLSVPANSGWILRLCRSTNSIYDFLSGMPFGDDSFTGIEKVWSGTTPGFFNFAVTNPNTYGVFQGDYIYAVLVNSTTYTGATKYAILGYSVQQVQDYSVAWHFDPGGASVGSWMDKMPGPEQLPGPIMLSEVLVNPTGLDAGSQWLEIYNSSQSPIDLANYYIRQGGTLHTMPSTMVAPFSTAIVAQNTTNFMIRYPGFSGQLAGSSFSIILSGERIELLQGTNYPGDLIDSVNFADPSFTLPAEGSSYHLNRTIAPFAPVENDYGWQWLLAYTNDGLSLNYGQEVANPGKLLWQVMPPSIDTAVPSDVSTNSATIGVNIFSVGGGTNLASASVAWGLADAGTNPTSWANLLALGDLPPGLWTTNITGLLPNTLYYTRAFASNSFGLSAGFLSQTFFTGGTNPAQPTYFKVSGVPFPCTIGQPVSLTVEAWNGTNILNSYTGTVYFYTPIASVLPANYTFTPSDNGVHTFTNELTFLTYATYGEITAYEFGNPSVMGSQRGFTVFQGPWDSYSDIHIHGISDPAPTGTWHTVSIAAVDGMMHYATNYTGTVFFSCSDPTAVLPNGGTYTFTEADGGIHTFTNGLRINTQGEHSFTAYDLPGPVTLGVSRTIPNITVQGIGFSTTVTHFAVEYPDQTVVGQWNNVAVEARNQFEITVPEYRGTIAFLSSDTLANLPPSHTFTMFDGGRFYMPYGLALNTTGTSHWIEVRDQNDTNLLGGVYNITVGNMPGFSSFEWDIPGLVIIGHPVTLDLTIYDSGGGIDTGYTSTVNFYFNNAFVSGPSNYTFTAGDMGSHRFTNAFTFLSGGEHNLFIQDTNVSGPSANIDIDAIPGGSGPTTAFEIEVPDSPLFAGSTGKLRIAALGNGNIINTNHNAAVVFSSGDPLATFTTPVFASFTNGLAEMSSQVSLGSAGYQWIRTSLQSDTNVYGETEVLLTGTGNIRYVDGVGGSDSNNGTGPATGWLTLSHALSQIAAGDTLIVRPNTYQESLDLPVSGTPAAPISIVGDNHGRFWSYGGSFQLMPTNGPALSLNMASNIYIHGVEIGNYSSQSAVLLNRAHDIALDNVKISSSTTGVDIMFSQRIDLRDLHLSSCPAVAVSISSNSSFISLRNSDFEYCSTAMKVLDSAIIQVEDCVVESGTTEGIVVQNADINLRRNFILGAPGHAVAGYGPATLINMSHNAIGGHNVGGLGGAVLLSGCASGCALVNNTIFFNDHGIQLLGTPGATIKNNIIAFNWGFGIDADAASTNLLYEDYNCVYASTTNWASSLTMGSNSISMDPRLADSSTSNPDLHLQSTGGRRGNNGWVNDAVSSPAIDAGALGDSFANEPLPNGSRIDMGIYGNTREASLTPPAASFNVVVSSAFGNPTPPVGTNVYPNGNPVYLSAPISVPDGSGTQQLNIGWSGTGDVPASGSSNMYDIATLITNSSITWLWQHQVMLSALSFTLDGSVSVSNGWYNYGSTNVVVQAIPSNGYHFNGWLGDLVTTNNPLSLTMTQSYTIQATFALDTLSILASNSANGLVSPTGVTTVPFGGSQFYSIIPDPNCSIVDVVVDGLSIGPTNGYLFSNVTNGPHSISASFAQNTHTLTVTSPYGTPNPAGITTSVWGTAISANVAGSPIVQGGTQYVATGWTGSGAAPSGTGTNTVFNLTLDSTLQWLWNTDYRLELVTPLNGSVSQTSTWVQTGLYVPVTASPSPGYSFSGWQGDVPVAAMASNPVVLLMNQARTLTATFQADPGNICAVLQPPQAVATGAQWRLTSGSDTNWHNSGAVVSNLAAASAPYTITFKPIAAWTAPADLTGIDIIGGGTTSIVATYLQSDMVLITGGTYPMGVVNGSGGHSVTLSSFYMDRAPVTVGEYMTFASATARTMPSAPSWGWANSNLPMVNVTWNDASAYAAWVGKRLPTEAEYEYAMRSGFTNRLYPWGNSVSSANANYNNSVGQPTVEGTYAANAFGLYDISGNVWSWCEDWYQSTLSGPVTNPNGPASGQYKVIRGGGWASSALRLQCAPRFSQTPTAAYVDVGFRCVADIGGVAGGTVAEPDRNANGVDDWWEEQHFGLSTFSTDTDSDNDGLSNADEYRAGTDPTSTVSVFTIMAPSNTPMAPFTIQWSSVAGKVYDIQRADVIKTGFVVVSNGIAATPPLNTFTDSNGLRRGIYRVRVR